ncbi:Ltp family lipoprotein [Phycicoccus flavus]|uniref:Ltp family lipoprotein n=1 Tax=Phycicoccus flavus TaxID=2502783 RepID=UPI000FEB7FBA|nr:Ltp family lipoprotein [Phycicoccus flavus]NHA67866.1 hypothetical protein [Phycicoccus flavus]
MHTRQLSLAAAAGAAVLALLSGCGSVDTYAAQDVGSEAGTTSSAPRSAASSKTAKPAKKGPSLTKEQRNAVRQARNYLDLTPFSQKGLVEQLVFEGYSKKDATKAVGTLRVDYRKQAARAAKNYLDLSPFSRKGLVDQLVFEGYTKAQAGYGVEQSGL